MGPQDRVFRWLQNAIEPTQHDEREDDLAVFRLFEVAAEDFSDLPNEARERVGLMCRRVVHPRPGPGHASNASGRAEAKTETPPPTV